MAMASVVLVALGLFVLAGMLASTGPDDGAGEAGGVIQRLIPTRDGDALRQSPIGVDLAPGWSMGSLSINGVPIPEQDWDTTPEIGLYQYVVPSGSDLLLGGQNCARAEVFSRADPTTTRTADWCFSVN
jgi:hypothetical protein